MAEARPGGTEGDHQLEGDGPGRRIHLARHGTGDGADPSRVHSSATGWPIFGDNIYGNGPRFGEPKLHLHSREIVVPISRNKEPVRVVAPAPPHMHEKLRACGWNEE